MIVPDLEALISETEQECVHAQRREAEKWAQERERKRAEDSIKRWERLRKNAEDRAWTPPADWPQYFPLSGSSYMTLRVSMPKPLVTGTLTTKRLPKA
jgi:hypothetical protein